MRVRTALLAAALVLPAVAPSAPAHGQTEVLVPPAPALAPPLPEITPARGDHVVVGTETIAGGEHRYPGRIVVPPGARLRILDATVVFEVAGEPASTGTPAGQQEVPLAGIVVQPGGRLDVVGAVLRNDERQGESYEQRRARRWALWLRGSARLERSTVAFATQVDVENGPATIRECTITDTYGSGVYVRNARDQVTITGNTIRRNGFLSGFGGGVYLINTNGVVVEGNVITEAAGTGIIANHPSTTGSYAWDDDPRIAGNLVHAAPSGGDATASTGIYSSGGDTSTSIADNAVVGAGVGVFTAYGTGARVLRNTLVGLPLAGEATVRRPAMVAATRASNGDAYVTAWHGNRVDGFATAFQNQWDGQPQVSGNDLAAPVAIHNISSAGQLSPRLPAAGNWFGDASGPRDDDDGDGSTPADNAGTGGRVTGNVDYSGWRAQPVAAPLLRVEVPQLAPASDGIASVPVDVTNAADQPVVADVHLLGLPQRWQADVPASVSLPPGASAELLVELAVPPDAAPATIAVGLVGRDLPVAAAGAVAVAPAG